VNPAGIYPQNQNVNQWTNAAAFAFAPLGSYGNLGWNNIKGPGAFQFDMALSRTFALHEKKTLQIRAEAFNLPNVLNANVPGASPTGSTQGNTNALNASNFGKITNDISGTNGLLQGDYRIIQLAMKFVF